MRIAITGVLGVSGVFVLRALREIGVEILATGRDAAAATVAAAVHDEPLPHSIYNIGSGEARSLYHHAELVRSLVPNADIEIGPGLDPMGFGVSYYTALDSTRARDDFGFEAPPLAVALKDYVRSLQDAA